MSVGTLSRSRRSESEYRDHLVVGSDDRALCGVEASEILPLDPQEWTQAVAGRMPVTIALELCSMCVRALFYTTIEVQETVEVTLNRWQTPT